MLRMGRAGSDFESVPLARIHFAPTVGEHGGSFFIFRPLFMVDIKCTSRHGPVTDCPVPATQEFVMEYMKLPPNSPQRFQLERRYGRTSLQKLVAKFEEEKALKDWLEKSATACPGCGVHVEKSHGCNHVCAKTFIGCLMNIQLRTGMTTTCWCCIQMVCARCKVHFCYRCGAKLLASNPYAHFSTAGFPCYKKLFDYQDTEDDGWQPVEGFDALE